MATIEWGRKIDLQDVLKAPGRSPEIPESADAYGWLIGSWELDALHYRGVDVTARRIKGEVHFGWVLEGRAVQDVWIRWLNESLSLAARRLSTGSRLGEIKQGRGF
jgi:hypothetical protein